MAVVALGFIFTGCGGGGGMLSEMNGTWQSDKGDDFIKLNLSGEQKFIEIGSNTVPITIKNIDEGSYIVTVDVKPANEKTSEWSFMQVWDDNGSAFTIKFDHDGEKETLTRVEG
jgi:hypothetical protein